MSNKDLEPNRIDHTVTIAKAVLSALPAGSVLAELVGAIIPNQRLDRLTKFAQELDSKCSKLSEDFIRSQLNNENFTDLLEESLKQAARSITDERRKHIASLIANGLSLNEIDFIETKQILRILGEINDVEVIWLRKHLVEVSGQDKEFLDKHAEELDIPIPSLHDPNNASTIEKYDKNTLRSSYKEHLAQLGLLEQKYELDKKTGQLKVDKDGKLKISGYKITRLGRLLLKYIGLTKDGFNPV